jgi:hypothetical protein
LKHSGELRIYKKKLKDNHFQTVQPTPDQDIGEIESVQYIPESPMSLYQGSTPTADALKSKLAVQVHKIKITGLVQKSIKKDVKKQNLRI